MEIPILPNNMTKYVAKEDHQSSPGNTEILPVFCNLSNTLSQMLLLKLKWTRHLFLLIDKHTIFIMSGEGTQMSQKIVNLARSVPKSDILKKTSTLYTENLY